MREADPAIVGHSRHTPDAQTPIASRRPAMVLFTHLLRLTVFASPVQVTPSSPVHQGAPVGLAQKRLMREAEPANSGHSGHTPKAQHVQEPLDINAQSAWEMHHRQVCILLSTYCCCK